MENLKIGVVSEYELCNGTNGAQTARNMNQVFRKYATNKRAIQLKFYKLRSGDFNLENKPR